MFLIIYTSLAIALPVPELIFRDRKRLHRFQPFPVSHHNRFTDEKHQKGSTLADDVCVCCGAVRKGERRAGGGTGSMEETLEKFGTKVSRANT